MAHSKRTIVFSCDFSSLEKFLFTYKNFSQFYFLLKSNFFYYFFFGKILRNFFKFSSFYVYLFQFILFSSDFLSSNCFLCGWFDRYIIVRTRRAPLEINQELRNAKLPLMPCVNLWTCVSYKTATTF